jgi:prophage regulatory protein
MALASIVNPRVSNRRPSDGTLSHKTKAAARFVEQSVSPLVTAPLLDGNDRLLRMQEVTKLVSISRATIYRYLNAGSFPAPIRIGARRVAWRASDINGWFAQLQVC